MPTRDLYGRFYSCYSVTVPSAFTTATGSSIQWDYAVIDFMSTNSRCRPEVENGTNSFACIRICHLVRSQARGVRIEQLDPVTVAAYVEEISFTHKLRHLASGVAITIVCATYPMVT